MTTIAKSVFLGLILGVAPAWAASPALLDYQPASSGSPALISAAAMLEPPDRSLMD